MKTRMISPTTHIHVLGNPSDNLVHGQRGGGGGGGGGWGGGGGVGGGGGGGILNGMARVDQLAF